MLSQTLTRVAPTIRYVIQRRQFSIVQQARAAIKSFEPHPFQRLPTTTTSQAADWKVQFVKLGRTASWYFPWYAAVIGWPLAAEWLCDGNM